MRLLRNSPISAVAAAAVACAACASSGTGRIPVEAPRTRAFVGTFDRVLIAGFLTEGVSDRERDLDVNLETARLLRMMLRSKASLNVIDTQPVHLPPAEATTPAARKAVFTDVAFWKRLGEEYRQPLILTGTVAFKRAGPQTAERQVGPRSVTVARPRFRLDLHLVFISGRTGEILDSFSLDPVAAQAPEGRTSALAMYLELMDRLSPSLLALFKAPDEVRVTSSLPAERAASRTAAVAIAAPSLHVASGR